MFSSAPPANPLCRRDEHAQHVLNAELMEKDFYVNGR